MTFNEQLIRKKKTKKDVALLAGLWAASFLIVTLMLYFALGLAAEKGNASAMAVAILASVGVVWLASRLSSNFTVEYEYSVFEGELSVDKIVGKRKRTRVVQVAAKRIEQLSPIAAKCEETKPFDRVVMAAPSREEATWYVTYSGKKNGRTLVLLAPDDEFFEELYKGQTREVKAACDEKRRRCGV